MVSNYRQIFSAPSPIKQELKCAFVLYLSGEGDPCCKQGYVQCWCVIIVGGGGGGVIPLEGEGGVGWYHWTSSCFIDLSSGSLSLPLTLTPISCCYCTFIIARSLLPFYSLPAYPCPFPNLAARYLMHQQIAKFFYFLLAIKPSVSRNWTNVKLFQMFVDD